MVNPRINPYILWSVISRAANTTQLKRTVFNNPRINPYILWSVISRAANTTQLKRTVFLTTGTRIITYP